MTGFLGVTDTDTRGSSHAWNPLTGHRQMVPVTWAGSFWERHRGAAQCRVKRPPLAALGNNVLLGYCT